LRTAGQFLLRLLDARPHDARPHDESFVTRAMFEEAVVARNDALGREIATLEQSIAAEGAHDKLVTAYDEVARRVAELEAIALSNEETGRMALAGGIRQLERAEAAERELREARADILTLGESLEQAVGRERAAAAEASELRSEHVMTRLEQRVILAERERDAMREALQRYGIHIDFCEARFPYNKCTCGFAAALAPATPQES
jgi:hypothetical protein